MPVAESVSRYISTLFAKEDEALTRARLDSPRLGLPAISVSAEEGRFLQVLVQAVQTRQAVEIGTLGGFSGIWIARGLLPGGKLYTLDIDAKHAQVARTHFEAAGVGDRVEIWVGNAHANLPQLEARRPFDFVFIDAEKEGYLRYFEWAVINLRPGGIVAAHNALRGGKVVNPAGDANSALMDAFNRRVAADPRVVSTIFPAGDGMLVAAKAG